VAIAPPTIRRHNTLHSTQYTVHSTHYIVHFTQYALRLPPSIQSDCCRPRAGCRCTVYCVLCNVYCVMCTVYCVLCTVYCVMCYVFFLLQQKNGTLASFVAIAPPTMNSKRLLSATRRLQVLCVLCSVSCVLCNVYCVLCNV